MNFQFSQKHNVDYSSKLTPSSGCFPVQLHFTVLVFYTLFQRISSSVKCSIHSGLALVA